MFARLCRGTPTFFGSPTFFRPWNDADPILRGNQNKIIMKPAMAGESGASWGAHFR
jgi:hypothetical protein